MSDRFSFSKTLTSVLDANLSFTALATSLATTLLESAFSATSGIAPSETSGRPGTATILLEGETGSTAVGFFVVENSLPHEISTSIEVSPLVAPDGRRVQSALRFDPGTISLSAGQQVVARVTAKISCRLVAGTRYQGEILVPGVAGARIPIVLRRKVETTPRKPSRKKSVSIPGAAAKKRFPRQKPARKRISG